MSDVTETVVEPTRLYESGWLSREIEKVTSDPHRRPRMTGANCTRSWPGRPETRAAYEMSRMTSEEKRAALMAPMTLAERIVHVANAEHYPAWDADMSEQTCACGENPSHDPEGHIAEAIRPLMEAHRESLIDEIIAKWPTGGSDVPSRGTVLAWLETDR